MPSTEEHRRAPSPSARTRLAARGGWAAALAALASLALAPLALAEDEGRSGEVIPGRYIVVLEDSVDRPGRTAHAQLRGRQGDVRFVYHAAIKGYAAAMSSSEAEVIRRKPGVKYVVPDRVVEVQEQQIPTGIERSMASANEALSLDEGDDLRVNADVAVLDTGIDFAHPDLNVVGRTDCVPIDEAPEVGECRDGFGNDRHSHGTHVAGTIGALDNGEGVVGVAPGVRLWAVRVLNAQGIGYQSWIVAGVDWVTARAGRIEVANMSLGCVCSMPALDEALDASTEAGVAYAVAAGNNAIDAGNVSPASNSNVMTVSALADYDGAPGGEGSPTCNSYGADDTSATFSNFGAAVNVAAPGVCIRSTVPGGGYGDKSGTSMATPHVAGAAAILASERKPEDLEDVEAIAQTLAEEGSQAWTDNSEDGIQEPLLDVGDDAVFAPADQVAVTGTAEALSASEATLHGEVNPGGQEAEYFFEYGTDEEYGSSVPVGRASAGSGDGYSAVEETVSGLSDETLYHYRLVAVNENGTFHGEDRVFGTTQPTLQSVNAVDIDANHATLTASIDPHGLETNYYFEYGTTTSYGRRGPESSVGSGTEPTGFELPVGALTGSKTYHFHVVATNAAGTSDSGDVTFTTPSSDWLVQDAPDPEGESIAELQGVACPSFDSCMTVGRAGGGLLTERWDGSEWTMETAPKPSSAASPMFHGVSCPSADFCVAVGRYSVSGEYRPLAERWDGEEWTVQTVSLPSGASGAYLSDVSCMSSAACTAVGRYEDPDTHPFVVRWNGAEWAEQSTPELKDRGAFESVSCTSASFCMATGRALGGGLGTAPLVEIWDGEFWSVIQDSPPNKEIPYGALSDVDCWADDACIAIGPYANHVEYWDGVEWRQEELPTPVASKWALLTSVSCMTAELCTLAGSYETNDAYQGPWALMRINGQWAVKSFEDPNQNEEPHPRNLRLQGTTCAASGHCFAVGSRWATGSVKTSPLIERYAVDAPVAAFAFAEGEGKVAHDSTGAHDGALEGAMWSEAGKYGGAAEFDGINDLIRVADDEELDLTDAFTLEAWVRPDTHPIAAGVVSKEGSGGESFSGYWLTSNFLTGGALGLTRNNTTTTTVSSGAKLPIGSWSHLAFTSDGANLRLYVNGNLTATKAATAAKEVNADLLIGRLGSSGYFDGKIDEVRLYDVPLSQSQIEADRDTPVRAPVAAFAFAEGEGKVAHDSTGAHDGALEGAMWSEAGKYGGAAEFDGINDLIRVADDEELDLTDAFTLEAWVRPDTHPIAAGVVSKEGSGGESFSGYWLTSNFLTGGALGLTRNNTTTTTVSSGAKLPIGSWSHLAFTSDGANLRLYVNGNLTATKAATAAKEVNADLLIGRLGSSGYFDGKIDEVRLYDVPLSQSQIEADRRGEY